MVEGVSEKTWESFDLEQYRPPSSRRPLHIMLIPLFSAWLVVWIAATFILGAWWMVRETMRSILRRNWP
jgi:hypothetical protein